MPWEQGDVTIRFPEDLWDKVACGGLELTDDFRRADMIHAVVGGWATQFCPSYKQSETSNGIRFTFSDKKDAIRFWQRWVCPESLRKSKIYVFDDIVNKGDAVDWLEENMAGKYKFFSPFGGVKAAVIIDDDTEDKELLTQFVLTHVGE